MTTYNGKQILSPLQKGTIRIVPFSGTVKDANDNPLERVVLLYKHNDNVFLSTRSDSNGIFSIDVPCGANDRIRVVAVGGRDSGDNSENSAIFDNIAG